MQTALATVAVILALTSNCSILKAQIPAERRYDPSGSVLVLLEGAAQARYGDNYVISYHIMDSLLANSKHGRYADPYGTLKGCLLFSAWREHEGDDSVVTGVYRSGKIIWNDYPGTKAGFGSWLLATRDINNDGEVDILQAEPDFQLMSRGGSGISYLWILSWNGKRGRMLNDIDSTTQQSTIVSIEEIYDLLDTHHNGVLDIRGKIPEIWQEYFPNHRPKTLPIITYTWNGARYGYWTNQRKIH